MQDAVFTVFIVDVKHKSAYRHFNTALLLDAHFKKLLYFFGRFLEIENKILHH